MHGGTPPLSEMILLLFPRPIKAMFDSPWYGLKTYACIMSISTIPSTHACMKVERSLTHVVSANEGYQ